MDTKPKPKSQSQSQSLSLTSLVELSEQEVRIEFSPNAKCRATVRLRSLSATAAVAFKVQTSSPSKFMVNPPAGIIPALSTAAFQVILKPQQQVPSPYPRSPSDRFLVKTAPFPGPPDPPPHPPGSVIAWFASRPTQDHRLRTAFVGPFLLHHAVSSGDRDAARNLIKRQRSLLSGLAPGESRALLQAARELASPDRMVSLLLEGGLKIGGGDGRTALHVAAEKGSVRCARALLEGGADKDARCRDGGTALHRAAARGDRAMVELLLGAGVDPALTDGRGRSPLDVARDKGHNKVVEILEQGEAVLVAARQGDLKRLELLLKTGAAINYCDQYGLTALHAAAMKGHKEVISMLIEYGLDVESRDKEGYSPLHLAIVGGSLDAVAMLVGKGANVNVKSRGRASPLHMATAMGHHHIAEFLISKGASSSS